MINSVDYDGDDKDKILDHLAFTVCDKYRCEVFWLRDNTDSYKMYLYKMLDNKDVLLYDVIFDSDLGIIIGNECVYTSQNVDDIVKQCFKVIEKYMKHPKNWGFE